MGSLSRGRTNSSAGSPNGNIVCGWVHKIIALVLVFTTFLLTRTFDHLYRIPVSSSSFVADCTEYRRISVIDSSGFLSWPQQGYGSSLSLKIYVYEDREVDGLRELMRGRDDNISAMTCKKGQWGTQVGDPRLIGQLRRQMIVQVSCGRREGRSILEVGSMNGSAEKGRSEVCLRKVGTTMLHNENGISSSRCGNSLCREEECYIHGCDLVIDSPGGRLGRVWLLWKSR